MNKIGALWNNVSSKGTPYMSGVIEVEGGDKIPVIIFDNGYKMNDKSPDKIVYLKEQQGQSENQPDWSQLPKGPQRAGEDDYSDIPF